VSPGASEADQGRGTATAVRDPVAERDARRNAREARRGPRTDRPEVRKPSRRTRPPLDARLTGGVAGLGIVAIAVAIAAVMSSQGSQGWLIGLVVSVASLALGAAVRSARRSAE
jgi:hypothetical protein